LVERSIQTTFTKKMTGNHLKKEWSTNYVHTSKSKEVVK
jgi:hypothetical protein